MSELTGFAGLEALLPGEGLDERFLNGNMKVIDALLRVGVLTHHHDQHAAIPDPALDPTADTNGTGGTIPADTTIYVEYTLVDADGGETAASTSALVTTAGGLVAPDSAPALALDTTAGTLLADNYYYAVSVTDGSGGETILGPVATITIPPGNAANQIEISGLAAILAGVDGGVTWRLWRAIGSGQWQMLNEGATDTFTDGGANCVDCGLTPPTAQSTKATNQLLVTVPPPADLTRIASFNVYASLDGTFDADCLLDNFPASQLGIQQTFNALTLLPGRPPELSLSVPGANRISLDTDTNGPWRMPVPTVADLPTTGNLDQDIRMAEADGTLYRWLAADSSWHVITTGGGGGTANDPAVVALGQAAASWTDADGGTAASLVVEERTDVTTIESDDFSVDGAGAPGWSTGRFGASGGIEIGVAGGISTDAIGYKAAQAPHGEIDLDYSVAVDNYYRIGLTWGHSSIGLFGMIDRHNGRLSIKIKRVSSGTNQDEADYVELAGIDSGGPEGWTNPAVGTPGSLVFTRLHNTLTLQDWRGGASPAGEVTVDVPVGDRTDWGDGVFLYAGQAHRYEEADAVTWDNWLVNRFDPHRQLKLSFNPGGDLVLFDDTGRVFLQPQGAEQDIDTYPADWSDGTTVPRGWRDLSGDIHLRGVAHKTTSTAPAAAELIATLPAALWPLVDQEVTVVTGDADGRSVGMIQILAADGTVHWLAGTSTDPATKSPYVRLDGISYRAAS